MPISITRTVAPTTIAPKYPTFSAGVVGFHDDSRACILFIFIYFIYLFIFRTDPSPRHATTAAAPPKTAAALGGAAAAAVGPPVSHRIRLPEGSEGRARQDRSDVQRSAFRRGRAGAGGRARAGGRVRAGVDGRVWTGGTEPCPTLSWRYTLQHPPPGPAQNPVGPQKQPNVRTWRRWEGVQDGREYRAEVRACAASFASIESSRADTSACACGCGCEGPRASLRL